MVAAVLLGKTDPLTNSWTPPVVPIAVAWVAGSVAAILVVRDPSVESGMDTFWDGTFVTLGPSGWRYTWNQMLQIGRLLLWEGPPGGGLTPVWPVLSLGLVGLGCLALWRKRTLLPLALLAVPLLAGTVASLLGQYPLAIRLWMWAIPLIVLLMVSGIFVLAPHTESRRALLVVGACLLLMGASRGRMSFYRSHTPDLGEESRSVIERLEVQRGPDEPVYVFARSAPAWWVYTTDWTQDLSELRMILRLASPGGPAFINDSVMGSASAADLDRLAVQDDSGMTLLGRSSGLRLAQRGLVTGVAEDWAPSETERFWNATPRCGWLFFTHVFRPERDAFLDAVRASGGVFSTVIEGSRASAERVCRASSATATAGGTEGSGR